MKINHLDLFSGIGGFHLGFERAGYKITSYFSEIDKHAIAVYKHQFPTSTYVGSVTNVRGADLPRINLITFGSPCQDFSLAGKRKGMEGQRSSLVLEAIRLISECRPSVFVWENVKGTFSSNDGADFWAIIQAFTDIGGYRLEWQLLNTSWFLPQNRERIYLVGYSTNPSGGGVFPIAAKGRKVTEPSINQIGTRLDSEGTQPYQQDRVYDADGIVPALCQGKSDLIVKEQYRIRRLTPIECERLQGFPDQHTAYGNYDGEVKPMNNSQRYKQCGNAVTVDVVAAVAKKCLPLFN
jgi:DNA (cytosine-5)-methyltransferase 1